MGSATHAVEFVPNTASSGMAAVSPPAPSERIAMTLFEADGSVGSRLVALCAEPGMGKRDILTRILSRAARGGVRVVRRDCAQMSPESCCAMLARLAKRLPETGEQTIVGLDVIPPSDESRVARQARALRRLWEAGISVVFSIRPEAMQLVEALPECLRVPPPMFLLHGSLGVASNSHRTFRLTRGIPCLSASLAGQNVDREGELPPIAYFDALCDLMESSLRSSLSDEERRLRLCMILLGDGGTAEAASILGMGRSHTDLLGSIRDHAPLFGVSRDLALFSCLSATVPESLPACLRALMPTSALYPDVGPACMGALIDRGDFSRAAVVAMLAECSVASYAVVERAADFIDVGELALVRRTVRTSRGSGDGLASVLRPLVVALDSRGVRRLPDAHSEGRLPTSMRLFAATRRVLWGKLPDARAEASLAGQLDRRLASHVGACALMLRGAFSVAQGLLVGLPGEGGRRCASNALLALDCEVARLLTGGAPSTGVQFTSWAEEFVLDHPLRGLSGYVSILRLVRAALSPDVDAGELELLASRGERSGDALVQVVALIVGSVSDLRAGSPARAQVRSTLASTLSKSFDADYLNRVARLLTDVARSLAGDRLGPRLLGAGRDDLDEVCALVWEVLMSESEPLLLSPLRGEVPWDALWLLRLLCSGMGELSDGLLERMPQSWKEAIAAAEGSWPPRRPAPTVLPRPEAERGDRMPRPVRVTLLGGFSLSVRDQGIPDWKLERRSMKSMLEYLVLHGGNAKRYEVVEQVWPECDYIQGFNRAYQTTSALRALVAKIDERMTLIAASRMSGEISVDMTIVDCDVLEFRARAREAVDSEDDVRTLECARIAERLYAGDLYLPPSDATGFIATMRIELRNLYADAMVEGSAAALSLGHDRTAARLAGNALVADDLREDAVNALVRALKACGRDVEAARQRRAFEDRRVRAEGRRRPRLAPAVPEVDEGEEGIVQEGLA